MCANGRPVTLQFASQNKVRFVSSSFHDFIDPFCFSKSDFRTSLTVNTLYGLNIQKPNLMRLPRRKKMVWGQRAAQAPLASGCTAFDAKSWSPTEATVQSVRLRSEPTAQDGRNSPRTNSPANIQSLTTDTDTWAHYTYTSTPTCIHHWQYARSCMQVRGCRMLMHGANKYVVLASVSRTFSGHKNRPSSACDFQYLEN